MKNLNLEDISYLQFLLGERMGFLKTDKRESDYEEIEYIKKLHELLKLK
jgi:hypothetical protein